MNDDRTDGEGSRCPSAEIDVPGEIDHADSRVAGGVDTGSALACAAQPRSTPGATVQPDTTRPHMQSPSLDAPARVLAPAAAPGGTSAPAAGCAPYSTGNRRHEP
jgi:hypothetical protein